ncbi:MAG: 6-bladed beta-propeller [Bacteroidota bacterium]
MTNRRNFIKGVSTAALGAITMPMLSAKVGRHKRIIDEDVILGHGDYQYKLQTNWAKMSAVKNPLLNCHEMVMDSKGRLFMLGDHTANNVLIFDKSGKLLDYWGTQYPGGHGLTISHEGEEDFLYLTDAGWYVNRRGETVRQNGRVTKTDLDGNVIFDIAHPQTVGAYEPTDYFCPTEVAIAPNGDIYIADGYSTDYILHYDAKGQFIRKWGGHDNEDENYNIHNAHGVTLDMRDQDNPLLVCSSRNKNEYKFFTLDGKYVRTLKLPGLYPCRAVIDDDNLYTGICWSKQKDGTMDWQAHSGFVTVLEGDTVVSNPGGSAPIYKDGQLQPAHQLSTRPIWHGHDVCVDEDKNLYVCQWNAGHSAPYKLERV